MINLTKRKAMPGTYVYTGIHNKATSIKHIQYSPKAFSVYPTEQILNDDMVDWIVVEGLTNVDLIRELCTKYNVDPLVIEDVLHVNQRTKIEIHDNYIFSVVKYSYMNKNKIEHDYISILLFRNTIITFSESVNLFIEDVITRIESKSSSIRQKQHDYLFYVLFDMIVDETMEVYNFIDQELDEIETNIMFLESSDQMRLYSIRKELVFLKSLSMQILFNTPKDLFKTEKFFHTETGKYYDDVIDHVMNVNNKVLSQLDNISHILDVYMNNMSNKMNQIMTTLTIFSAIFIPLSFIAGVFGMNFVNFPILQHNYGMVFFIMICILLPIAMLSYFKVKKWF